MFIAKIPKLFNQVLLQLGCFQYLTKLTGISKLLSSCRDVQKMKGLFQVMGEIIDQDLKFWSPDPHCSPLTHDYYYYYTHTPQTNKQKQNTKRGKQAERKINFQQIISVS